MTPIEVNSSPNPSNAAPNWRWFCNNSIHPPVLSVFFMAPPLSLSFLLLGFLLFYIISNVWGTISSDLKWHSIVHLQMDGCYSGYHTHHHNSYYLRLSLYSLENYLYSHIVHVYWYCRCYWKVLVHCISQNSPFYDVDDDDDNNVNSYYTCHAFMQW